jgi:hypothetical protein
MLPTNPLRIHRTALFLGLNLDEMSISTLDHLLLSYGGIRLGMSIQWTEDTSDGCKSG